jgi:hypothetical protein
LLAGDFSSCWANPAIAGSAATAAKAKTNDLAHGEGPFCIGKVFGMRTR